MEADQPKRSRNIQDLKARLGKGGAAPAPGRAPGGPPASGSVPPPVGSPTAGSVPPPTFGSVPAPVGAPRQSQPPARASDPFAAVAAAPAGPQEVRLVVDEKPVEESETGRRRRGLALILLGVGLLGGAAAGFGVGSTSADRQLYTRAVTDGKAVYEKVRSASDAVNKAQRFVQSAVKAAQPTGGSPRVDYEAIAALRALERPLKSEDFFRKSYQLFNVATVDALFEYYNNVDQLWGRFTALANSTLPDARRQVLDQSAQTAGEVAVTQTGCVPLVENEQYSCGMVFATIPPVEEGQPPPTTAQVMLRKGTAPVEKTIYQGQELGDDASDYVILTHTQRSIAVLGQPASEYAEYSRDLLQIAGLLQRTIEVQGRLERELGEIAKLAEL